MIVKHMNNIYALQLDYKLPSVTCMHERTRTHTHTDILLEQWYLVTIVNKLINRSIYFRYGKLERQRTAVNWGTERLLPALVSDLARNSERLCLIVPTEFFWHLLKLKTIFHVQVSSSTDEERHCGLLERDFLQVRWMTFPSPNQQCRSSVNASDLEIWCHQRRADCQTAAEVVPLFATNSQQTTPPEKTERPACSVHTQSV